MKKVLLILFLVILATFVLASVHGTITSISTTGHVLTDISLGVLQRNSIEEGDMLSVELTEITLEIPFVRRYADVPLGMFLADRVQALSESEPSTRTQTWSFNPLHLNRRFLVKPIPAISSNNILCFLWYYVFKPPFFSQLFSRGTSLRPGRLVL